MGTLEPASGSSTGPCTPFSRHAAEPRQRQCPTGGIGLRYRLTAWLGLVIGLLLALNYAVLQLVILPGFAQVENTEASRNVDRTLNALGGELQELHANAGDYANWDDTYAFAAGQANGFEEVNGTPVSMAHLDLAVFAVLDRQGTLRLGRMRGGDTVIPLPRELLPYLNHLPQRFTPQGGEGIVATTLGLWLVSAQPILRTDGSGPATGTLIMARWLDDDVRARLEARTQERIALWPADAVELPPEQAATLRELVDSGASRLLQTRHASHVAAYSLLRDIAGRPALLLQTDIPRSTTLLGIEATRTATLGFILSALLALVVLGLLLQRLIVSPLAALTAHLLDIRRTGDLSRSLVLARGDEIGTLAREFDGMRASLHTAQQELRDTFDSIDDLFFALDRELRFTIVNHACLAAWGLAPEALLGRPFLAVFPQLAGSEAMRVVERVLATGQAERVETYARTIKTLVELHVVPRRNGGLVVQLHDISKRKEAERAKSAFLATMSHEIRTPLTAILGFTDLLARSPLSPEQQEQLRIVRDTGRTLLTVVNDILDLSKLEAGRMSLERIPVELPALLREALATAELLGAEKGLTFQAELAADLPARVEGDPVRLKQVVGNLLFNALKFTERGGITLRAHLAGREGDATRVRVAVEDTGIGIASEDLPRLFGMFEQADQSTTRRFGGTGLGLVICKRLVEAMGGRIGVESRPGQGSTFWFELPFRVLAGAERLAASAAPSVAVPGRSLRVLAVDDVATNRLLLTALLRELGHLPVTAEDGVKAVEAAGQERFDLILMDLHMPGMDGFMATRAIRAGGGPNVGTPIVALTADVLPETAAACREAGMDGHLTKPIEPRFLSELTAQLITVSARAAVGGTGDGGATECLDQEVSEALARRVGPAMMAFLRDVMRTDAEAALQALGAALACGDTAGAGRHAHRLAGVAASFGGKAVAAGARAVEAAAKAGDLAGCAEKCRTLEGELRRFIVAVEADARATTP
jgi:PAS domain S-box-containing protein